MSHRPQGNKFKVVGSRIRGRGDKPTLYQMSLSVEPDGRIKIKRRPAESGYSRMTDAQLRGIASSLRLERIVASASIDANNTVWVQLHRGVELVVFSRRLNSMLRRKAAMNAHPAGSRR